MKSNETNHSIQMAEPWPRKTTISSHEELGSSWETRWHGVLADLPSPLIVDMAPESQNCFFVEGPVVNDKWLDVSDEIFPWNKLVLTYHSLVLNNPFSLAITLFSHAINPFTYVITLFPHAINPFSHERIMTSWSNSKKNGYEWFFFDPDTGKYWNY